MAFCENCIHYEVCEVDYDMMSDEVLTFFPHNEDCKFFKSTADVVEVKHGEWILCEREKGWYKDYHDKNEYCHYCSVCKEESNGDSGSDLTEPFYYLSNYCPNCGAKMDGGNAE